MARNVLFVDPIDDDKQRDDNKKNVKVVIYFAAYFIFLISITLIGLLHKRSRVQYDNKYTHRSYFNILQR